jgi:hypothetical protein
LFTFALLLPLLPVGCGGAKGVAVSTDTPLSGFNSQQLLLQLIAATPPAPGAAANAMPQAFIPPGFGGAGTIGFTFNGSVLGAPPGVEPLTINQPIVVGPDFTANPALVSGRGNLDFNVQIMGLPAPVANGLNDPLTGLPQFGYNIDARDGNENAIEAANPLYWARTSPCPGDTTVVSADNRPFRCNVINDGVLQLWLFARTSVPTTTTPPPIGQRQALSVVYRRRADAGGPAGSIRGFTNPAGADPAGVQLDDIRVTVPGVFPSTHPLAGTPIERALRMVGLPTFRPNANGTANTRVFVLGERVLDAATTGGAEIAIVPRNAFGIASLPAGTFPPGTPETVVILTRTVPGVDALQVERFLEGIATFGIGLSIEPPGEMTGDLTLRNPIDVFLFR